jgi:[NiFe] hydrogenase small subunit
MEKESKLNEKLRGEGVSRRDFMKFCAYLTATLGLSSSFVPRVAAKWSTPGAQVKCFGV